MAETENGDCRKLAIILPLFYFISFQIKKGAAMGDRKKEEERPFSLFDDSEDDDGENNSGFDSDVSIASSSEDGFASSEDVRACLLAHACRCLCVFVCVCVHSCDDDSVARFAGRIGTNNT